jgi:hypothetical protein
MPGRVADARGRALRDAEERDRLVDAGGVDDRFQIVDAPVE